MQLNNLIFVGGVGRSGTSILGTLLASTKNSEFFYEPAVLMYLIENAPELHNADMWKDLMKISLYKEMVKGALAGRNLNLNPNDNSSVYKFRSIEAVNQRLEKSVPQFEINEKFPHTNAIVKTLDNIRQFQYIQKEFNYAKAVIIYRNPVDTINSLFRKHWYSDEQLSVEGPEPARNMTEYKGFRMNGYLQPDVYDQWIEMSEVDRICYYYQLHLNLFAELSQNDNVFLVSYDEMIKSKAVGEKLIERMGLSTGEKTPEILDGLKPTSSSRETPDFLSQPSEKSKQSVFEAFENLNRLVL